MIKITAKFFEILRQTGIKNFGIIIIILVFPNINYAQIQAHEVGFPPDSTQLYILGTDTVPASLTYGQGKWYNAFGMINALDSLTMDHDWYEAGDTAPNSIDDEMYHMGDVHIGDSTMSGMGVLNVVGRIDQQFPAIGNSSIAIGPYTLSSLTTGGDNMAIGSGALWFNDAGNFNTALGIGALTLNTTGSSNVAVGIGTLLANQTGNDNVAVGRLAISNNSTGSENTAIGTRAGENAAGSGNIFIGYNAANWGEYSSNKLYIENSNSLSPLIWGDFANDSIKINGKLGYTINSGVPTKISGRNGDYFSDLTTGWGLNLSSGDLKADTSKLVTQYDLLHLDHGALDGRADDDHLQYALLAGRTGTGGQKLIGGTANTDGLTLQTTSANGTTGANMHFLVGNNGATEAMTILNGSTVGINFTSPASALHVKALSTSHDVLRLDNSSSVGFTDVHFGSSTPRGIRIYAHENLLTTSPAGAGFHAFRSSDAVYPGQIFFDSGAAAGAALIFRTAGAFGTITERMKITDAGLVGIGTSVTTPSARLHVISTTEQLRAGYDASNYWRATTSSSGLITLDAAGSGSAFSFNDNIGVGVTPLVKIHSQGTTEQLRLGYDASNYFSTTVGSSGLTTFDANGSGSGFLIIDNVGIGATPTAKFQIRSTTEQQRTEYDASNYYKTTVGSTGTVTLDAFGSGSGFSFSDDASVPDENYGSGWNGSTEVPTKNAVYDKIEAVKTYTAIVTQTGTSAPSATVLENNLGSLTWNYTDQGQYTITSSSLFTSNKTIITFSQPRAVEGDSYIHVFNADWTDSSTLTISSNYVCLACTPPGITLANNLMSESLVSIEIKVYP